MIHTSSPRVVLTHALRTPIGRYLGAFADLRAAATAMSRAGPAAEPDPGNQRIYDAAFRAYQEAARALAP